MKRKIFGNNEMKDSLVCNMCKKTLEPGNFSAISLETKDGISKSSAIEWMSLTVCADCLLKIMTFIIKNTKDEEVKNESLRS